MKTTVQYLNCVAQGPFYNTEHYGYGGNSWNNIGPYPTLDDATDDASRRLVGCRTMQSVYVRKAGECNEVIAIVSKKDC